MKFLGANVDESQQLQNTQNSPNEIDIEVMENQPSGNNDISVKKLFFFISLIKIILLFINRRDFKPLFLHERIHQ